MIKDKNMYPVTERQNVEFRKRNDFQSPTPVNRPISQILQLGSSRWCLILLDSDREQNTLHVTPQPIIG
jgi:hypothetical protein